ncbi:MAG: hypothetical protein J0H31_10465 [Alphaproteobacteria bacterium]|nr:hypothetical protein [Alphaproteobacteria bacterium]
MAVIGVDCVNAVHAPAASSDEEQEGFNAVDAATQACRSNEFDKFLRLYTQSPAVRERFTADRINTAPAAVRPDFVSKAEYLNRFPLAMRGWNYISPNGPSPAEHPSYVLVRTRPVSRTVRRVDFVPARFDAEPEDGKFIGVPVELRGMPTQLAFISGDDGCWRATSEILAPKDTPFELGLQRLHCAVRSDDYRRELERVSGTIPDHPEDMDVGRDLAACAKLTDMIETAIRRDPGLSELRRQADERLATLARSQMPAGQTALARDESRFRRSLMRDQYVLADGTTGDWDMPGNLEQRLRGRLEELNRIEPSRQDYEGLWTSVSGTLDITREGNAYRIDANPVDIDFLAWTCEFEGGMHKTKDGLELDDAEDETVHARLRNGVLVVEHLPTPGGFIGTCGAGGSIGGTYFPARPVPERRAGPDGEPVP